MTDEAWNAGFVKCLGVRLAGDLIGDVDEHGEPIVGDTLLILLNAHHEPIPFTLPEHQASGTGNGSSTPPTPWLRPSFHEGKEPYGLQGRTVVALPAPLTRHEEAGKALSAEQSDRLLRQAQPGSC